MKDIAKNKAKSPDEAKAESLRPKRWDESLEKPPIDYSDIFGEDEGQLPGLAVWEIENFLPNRVEEVAHGMLEWTSPLVSVINRIRFSLKNYDKIVITVSLCRGSMCSHLPLSFCR